jgi:integrase/DNA-directed RNA polymerase subunit RPC12/RpoP
LESVSVLKCPDCGSTVFENAGKYYPDENTEIQRYACKRCGKRISDPQALKTYNANKPITFKYALKGEAKNLRSWQAIVQKAIAGETTTLETTLLSYAWHEKKRGISDATIAHRTFRLNVMMKRGAKLNDPDSFLTVLTTENFTESSKYHYVQSYISYCRAFKIAFEKPHINYEPKEQYTPKPAEVQTLVQNMGKEQATLCQTLADTGARIGELARLLWKEIDPVGKVVFINHPEKHSKARKITVSDQTIKMLMDMPKKYGQNVFNPNKRTLQSTFARSRNRIAKKLCMPNLLNIHHHSFRRYFADQTYKKTRFNTRKVQARLGHKRLSSTEKYFGTFDDDACTYETARAYTIADQEELRALGYELFDTGIDEEGKPVKLYSRLK